MNRKFERIIMRIIGSWQFIDGIITIIVFGLVKNQFGMIESAKGSFVITSLLGTLLLGLGLANFLFAKRFVKDNEVNKNIGYFLIGQALFSLLIWDLITLVLSMTAGVILLSKNKGIRLNPVNK